MIHVDRDQEAKPERLLTHGVPETAAAIAQTLANRAEPDPKQRKKPTFAEYKHPSVKAALERLFHGKCAYCESKYDIVQPMDVEHWRPKGEVEFPTSKEKKPGYYWLAAEWTNLLPSCIDCNRRRTHVVDGVEQKLGKRALFPLADETKRWASHDDAAGDEGPLLLDPCRDTPEALLRFGDDAVVRAQDGLDDLARARVEASVRIYGLNRPALVQERLIWVRVLQHRMHAIDLVAQLVDDTDASTAPPDATPEEREERAALHDLLLDLLELELDALAAHSAPDRRYCLMARQLTGDFLDRYGVTP